MIKDCSYAASDLSCGGDGLLASEHTLLDVEEEEDAMRGRHC